jgi:hypothetical protein
MPAGSTEWRTVSFGETVNGAEVGFAFVIPAF